METKGGLLLVFVVLALSAATTNATIVTIELTGEVTYVDEYSSILQELFHVGDPVTGIYVYDTDTADTNPLGNVSDYVHTINPYGIFLTVGEFMIQSNPERPEFLIEILNDWRGEDAYLLRSYNNMPLPNGIPVWYIYWQLTDYSGTAISSVMLPTEPPTLKNWEIDSGLNINFGYKGGSVIGTKITSVELVPEPATSVLLFLVGLILFKQRKS
jgi:hypothetical protein